MVALVDELASPDRHVLVGGTIVREAIYSRAIQLARVLRENKNMSILLIF
jgi:hypothetical protein